jgi:hypothetical protein
VNSYQQRAKYSTRLVEFEILILDGWLKAIDDFGDLSRF